MPPVVCPVGLPMSSERTPNDALPCLWLRESTNHLGVAAARRLPGRSKNDGRAGRLTWWGAGRPGLPPASRLRPRAAMRASGGGHEDLGPALFELEGPPAFPAWGASAGRPDRAGRDPPRDVALPATARRRPLRHGEPVAGKGRGGRACPRRTKREGRIRHGAAQDARKADPATEEALGGKAALRARADRVASGSHR
jgi:hypothetical protein